MSYIRKLSLHALVPYKSYMTCVRRRSAVYHFARKWRFHFPLIPIPLNWKLNSIELELIGFEVSYCIQNSRLHLLIGGTVRVTSAPIVGTALMS
jgi:hypothetical protein